MLRAAAPLAALLVAALLVWQGSNAAFSATTDNTGNAWATGNLFLENNGGIGSTYSGTTAALFNESNLKPGNTGVKCITVQSTGSLAGNLRLYRGVIGGTNGTALAGALDVTVDAVAVSFATNVGANCAGYTGGTSGAVYNGTLNAMPTTYAAASGTAVAGGNQHLVYRIGWTLNSGAGNALQSSNATANLTWEIN
jgi:hypothetical protein